MLYFVDSPFEISILIDPSEVVPLGVVDLVVRLEHSHSVDEKKVWNP